MDMPTPVAPVDTAPAPTGAPMPSQVPKDLVSRFKGRIEASKRNKKTFAARWKENVDARLGTPNTRVSEGVQTASEVQSEVNPDWALTKTKTANLYSQVPQVQVTHENKQYAPAIGPFAKALNYELSEKRANVGVAMEEVLNDVVNASGVGAVIVGYAARFDTVMVPATEPGAPQAPQMPGMPAAAPMPPAPPIPTQRMVSDKFYVTRISPSDLLWPEEFTGSNFDDGDWIGHSGRMGWAEAQNDFKLTDADKEACCGDENRSAEDLRNDPEKSALSDVDKVSYDEIFYWRYRIDPDEKSFSAIYRMVFVKGRTEPVIDEPWKGQKLDPQTKKYQGACRFPIRVLTLTYITDNPVPPSDTAAGRPQVDDMRRSRADMFKNRKSSIPIRWFDVNRVDPTIQDTLMRGTWQGMIPTNGDGSRTIGEIARASYPSEDLAFDRQTKADLMESWQVGPNQAGSEAGGDVTAAESKIVQANFATRIGQERAKVAMFFLGAVEVVAGFMVLYSDFPILNDQERQSMNQAWDMKSVLPDVVLKIRPDSTIVIDSQQRIARVTQFLNVTAKSGYVNIEPLIRELAELNGFDTAEVMKQPQPPPPAEPNMSYRFTGKDDLFNPVVMAMLIKSKQAPSPEDLRAAMQLLKTAQGTQQDGPVPGTEPATDPTTGDKPPQGLPDAQPDYGLMNKVMKRSRDAGGE